MPLCREDLDELIERTVKPTQSEAAERHDMAKEAFRRAAARGHANSFFGLMDAELEVIRERALSRFRFTTGK